MAALDLNSSNFEDLGEEFHLHDPFKPSPNVGLQVADKIIQNQALDRPLSKKSARGLTYGRGAPKTRDEQQRIMVVWDAFCSTVNHDPSTCPTGELIYRFIDTRVRHTIPRIGGKMKPSLSVIKGVWRRLIDLLKFRHEELLTHYTPYWVAHIGTRLDQLAASKQLERGVWRKRQWVGFKVVQKMSQIWLRRALDEGCVSWDRVLLKLLGVLLQASCASRSGDIARSTLYKGFECLCYKHLELGFGRRREPLSVQDLTLKITIEYAKGHKSALNEDVVVFVDPMEDGAQSVVCVIKVLLVVALRLGRVKGTSIDNVLATASSRHDGLIEWTGPEAPVLCQMSRGVTSVLLDKPAHQSQIKHAIKEMALAAGILAPLNSHDLRTGSLRDSTYLKQSIDGVADRCTAMISNHSHITLVRGTTQNYVGPLEQPLWNMRAANPVDSRVAPQFAPTPFTKTSNFKPQEIDAYMEEHGMDTHDTSKRTIAGRALKKDAADAWRLEQGSALSPLMIATPSKRQPLRQRSASEKNVDAGRTPSETNRQPSNKVSIRLDDVQTYTTTPAARKSPATSPSLGLDTDANANIDPQLLQLDDVEDAEVDSSQLDYVVGLIEQSPAEDLGTEPMNIDQDADDEAVDQALADTLPPSNENVDTTSDPTLLSGNDFVVKFSAINVYRLKRIFDTSDPETVARYVPTGNSRGPPEPFLYYCCKCGYSNRWFDVVQTHEVACKKDATVPSTSHNCHYDGCNKSYAKRETLLSHIGNVHEWTPSACTRCPDKPDVLFEIHLDWQKHHKDAHNDLDSPTVCPYATDCGQDKTWTDKAIFKQHLRTVHKKTPEQIADIIPRKKMVRTKFESFCPATPCDITEAFTSAAALRRHLIDVHKVTPIEAEAQVPLTKREQTSKRKKAEKEALDQDEDGVDHAPPAKRSRKRKVNPVDDVQFEGP